MMQNFIKWFKTFVVRYFGWEFRAPSQLEDKRPGSPEPALELCPDIEEGSCCEDPENQRLDPSSGELDCVSCGATLPVPETPGPNPFEDPPMESYELPRRPLLLSPHQVKAEIERMGFEFFRGQYNPNLFGIRILEDANEWNDLIGCLYEDEFGELQMDMYRGTTDPGIPWLENPSREDGCAVLATGQHRGCWVFGFHRGKYRALIQHGNKVSVWRDNSRDSKIDVGSHDPIPGFYGINLHRASAHRLVDDVGFYSAGCVVIRDAGEYNELLDFLDSTQEVWGDRFSFTLLNWPFGVDDAQA